MEKKGITIYGAGNVDYELLEGEKYLKIIWYRRDKIGRQTIVSREVFEKIKGNKSANENSAIWKRCLGESKTKRPEKYVVYRCGNERCPGKCYYKVIHTNLTCSKVAYYKKDERHEI